MSGLPAPLAVLTIDLPRGLSPDTTPLIRVREPPMMLLAMLLTLLPLRLALDAVGNCDGLLRGLSSPDFGSDILAKCPF